MTSYDYRRGESVRVDGEKAPFYVVCAQGPNTIWVQTIKGESFPIAVSLIRKGLHDPGGE